MEPFVVFAIGGAVILLGFIGEWIFEKTGIPDPIWLMIFGIVLGKFYPISDYEAFTQIGAVFTVFALIYILFEGLLNTDLKSFFQGVIKGSEVSILHYILTVAVTIGFMKLFGWGLMEGLLLGIILTDSAQAVIIPIMKRLKISKEAYSTLTFESAISDVFGIVGAITVINIILMQSTSFAEVGQKLLYTLSVSIFLGILGGFLWSALQKRMDTFAKSYMTTIGALLLLYSGVEYMGANGAIACLAFAVIYANTKQIFAAFHKDGGEEIAPGAKFFYAEISFFVKSFFFVYLGLSINLENINIILAGIALSILIMLIRPLAVKLSGIGKMVNDKDRVYVEILNPKGTAAAVLVLLLFQYNLPYAEDFSTLVFSAIAFSIFACVFLVFLTNRNHFHGFWNWRSKVEVVEEKETQEED